MAAPQRRRLCVCYPAAAAQQKRHGWLLLVLPRAAQEGSRAGALSVPSRRAAVGGWRRQPAAIEWVALLGCCDVKVSGISFLDDLYGLAGHKALRARRDKGKLSGWSLVCRSATLLRQFAMPRALLGRQRPRQATETAACSSGSMGVQSEALLLFPAFRRHDQRTHRRTGPADSRARSAKRHEWLAAAGRLAAATGNWAARSGLRAAGAGCSGPREGHVRSGWGAGGACRGRHRAHRALQTPINEICSHGSLSRGAACHSASAHPLPPPPLLPRLFRTLVQGQYAYGGQQVSGGARVATFAGRRRRVAR